MTGQSDRTSVGTHARTFLTADIRGYTAYTARHGDQAASRLAREFAEVAAEGVEAWSGELVELRGDLALAVFDSPPLAVRAAIELQDAFADEAACDASLPLAVGIGIDAGEAVVVGNGYRGSAFNLAARLCSVSKAGEIHARGCCQFQFKGTNTEPLGGPDGSEAPATGKVAEFPYCVVARFEAGVIAEFDEYFDRLEMLGQLGLA